MSLVQKYDLYSSAFRRVSHATFARMRQDDPILLQPGLDAETPIWFISRYALAEQVLLDDTRFVRDPALVFPPQEVEALFSSSNPQVDALVNNHMLNRDGADHHRLRSLVSKAFTPRIIQAMRPRIEEIALHLLDRVAPRGEMDLVSEYAFPLPITVIAELLGIPMHNRDQFRTWSNAFVRPTVSTEDQQAVMPLLAEFAAYMQTLVMERRQNPGDDLLSGLIHAEEQGDRLSPGELFSMLALLIVAGHETTVSLIGNAVLALLQHPHTLAQLQSNPGLIPTAVEELLRYDSPVERAIVRFVAEDVVVGGQQLRRRDLVIVLLASANRDEARFAHPDELDITRKLTAHLAFGKGAHYCLGAPLARLEGEIALRLLIERLPELCLDISPEALEWRDVPLFHSLVRLPVRWHVSG